MKNIIRSKILYKSLTLIILMVGLVFFVSNKSSVEAKNSIRSGECQDQCYAAKSGCDAEADTQNSLCMAEVDQGYWECQQQAYSDHISCLQSGIGQGYCGDKYTDDLNLCNNEQGWADQFCLNNQTSDKGWCNTEYSFCLENCPPN